MKKGCQLLATLVCLTAVRGIEPEAVSRLPPPPAARLSPAELAIWRDPAFQRRFTESYLAETDVEPRVTVVERDQMQKVLALIAGEKIDEALRLLEKGRGEATSAVVDFTVGNIHFQREALTEAASAYRMAVQKFPKFRRAWRNLGLIHVRQGDFSPAVDAFTRVIELGGADAITYGLLGFAYASLDNSLTAETAYRQAIMLDPATLDWKMGLARSLFKQRRYSEAVSLCALLLEDLPERADLWLLQANAFIGLNQPLKAAENYELIDRMGKATANSLNMLGDIYVNEELYGMAVDSYGRALTLDSASGVPRALRAARVLTMRGALDETARLLDAIETSSTADMQPEQKKELLKMRARLAVAEGSGEEEVEVLKQIVALDPLDGEALILLGQHSYRSGDAERAIFYYERAAALDKHEADAKVRHAQVLVAKGKYGEALPLLRRAQDLKPREDVQKYLDQVERIAKNR